MPVAEYAADSLNNKLYSSEFSHENETASAGYYSVKLDRWDIRAELTAGQRAAMHRYTFPTEVAEPMIVVDLKHRDVLLESDIYQVADNAIAGFRRSSAWSTDQMVWFYIEFSAKIAEFKPFGKKGALLTFAPESKEIIAKAGISSVSEEGALANLTSEVAPTSFNFDVLHAKSVELWNQYLSKIDVRQGCDDEERLRTFYTAMYHTAIAPNIYSDVDGQYRGMDKKIHQAEGFDRYTVFSLWDTFRTLHPLLALIEQERTDDFLQSFLTIYNEGDKLPIWELSGFETNCMIGYNSVSVIADAINKGIGREYADSLLDAMVESSNQDEFGIRHYIKYYMIPAELEHESVSKTLEYAYDDWCIAQVADYLYRETGEQSYAEIYETYMKHSGSYANVLDPETRLMRPMLNGMWLKPFDGREVNNHYTEANSWQYSFFAPHDVNGLIKYHGGDEAFCAILDTLFTMSPKTKGRTQVDITGLIGQYAHGNEPSHQTAYLYAYAGQPWKTYERVNQILTTLYTDKPDGLCGNDDCGQMSAWYVMSAIGLYPTCPGRSEYVLSAPLFNDITITLENYNTVSIKCKGKGKYIHSIVVNGQERSQSFITYDDIKDGGELIFYLGDEPSPTFGVAPTDRPTAYGYNTDDFVRNPWFEAAGDTFEDSLTVAVNSVDNKAFYCANGSTFKPYTEPIVLDKTTTLSIYAENSRGDKSAVVTATFHKEKDDYDITTFCNYNPQYNARGERGLIDGLRGSVNWKTGGWQGYQATDFSALIDLRGERYVRLIGSGYCQDARSWIWMPRYVEYFVSNDGETFTKVGQVYNTIGEQDYEIQTKDFVLTLPSHVKARYVKVFAKNFGTIPEWHLGHGGEGFIFIDEFWVE